MPITNFSYGWDDLQFNSDGQIIFDSIDYTLKTLFINFNGYSGFNGSKIVVQLRDAALSFLFFQVPEPWQLNPHPANFTYYNEDVANISNVNIACNNPLTLFYNFNGQGNNIDPQDYTISGYIET